MDDSLSTLVVPTIFIAVGLWLWNRKTDGYPGPSPYPLIGNIPQVLQGSVDFDRKLVQLHKQYGNIFRLELGEIVTIFVFGLENIENVLIHQGDNFSDRPSWLYIPDKLLKKKGLIWSNGENWKRVRSLVVQTMHNPSCASTIEEETLQDVASLIEQLKQEGGQLVNPYEYFRKLAFSLISNFIFGVKFGEDDTKFLREGVEYLTLRNKSQLPENMFPFLAVFMKSKHSAAMQKEQEMFHFIEQRIADHEKSLDHAHPKDLIDMFLLQMEKLNTEEQQSLCRDFVRAVIDLYVYGFEMNTSSLLWAIIAMAQYPDVQRNCQDELIKVFQDPVDTVSCQYRERLPYCSSTLKEILRMFGPGVMTAPHSAKQDAVVVGHKVSANQMIVCNLSEPRFDATVWDDPKKFSPERFINSKEDLTDRPAWTIYGLGPRSCPAKKFAEDTNFLVIMNLLRHFRIHGGDNVSDFKVDSEYKGVSSKPKPFEISFSPR